jgi:hypothetical protein
MRSRARSGRGRQQAHPALLPRGTVELGFRGLHAFRPVLRRCPAVIDYQDKRPAAGQLGCGMHHRARQAHDHQRSRQQAQQQKPPGRVRWCFFLRCQAQQEADRREALCLRRRRGHAQQEPQRRQRQQRQQQPRLSEGEGA